MAETDELKQAVAWMTANAPKDEDDNLHCPWCGYNTVETEGNRQRLGLTNHVRQQHPEKVMAAYLNPELGFDAFSILLRQKADEDEAKAYIDDRLSVLDERDEYDMLEIPEEFRKKQNIEGGRYRWADPRKVQRYKTLGAQIAKRPEDWTPSETPTSSEDTTMRVNELTLVYFPPDLYKKRQRLKQQRADELIGNLTSKKEDLEGRMGDVEKMIYEGFRKRNMPHQNAMVAARNFMKRAERGPRPDPMNETVITRG